MKLAAKVSVVIIIMAIASLLVAVHYFNQAIDTPANNDATTIEIAKSTKTEDIAKMLKAEGLISNEKVFVLLSKREGRIIKAGFYDVPAKVTMRQLHALLVSGKIKQVRITIPEGYRVEQISQVLAKQQLVDYDDFVKAAKPYEGRLFPDTYIFPYRVSQTEIIKAMRDDFANRTKGYVISNEQLILASIVEREAVKDEERALIAGVYQNRLNIHMKLEADPTVQYGRDDNELVKLSSAQKQKYKFWKPIVLSDYQSVNSPYNTYLTLAEIPSPIANPGLKSIMAAIEPAKHDYYYFLHKDGQIYLSKTLEEHNSKRASILGAKLK